MSCNFHPLCNDGTRTKERHRLSYKSQAMRSIPTEQLITRMVSTKWERTQWITQMNYYKNEFSLIQIPSITMFEELISRKGRPRRYFLSGRLHSRALKNSWVGYTSHYQPRGPEWIRGWSSASRTHKNLAIWFRFRDKDELGAMAWHQIRSINPNSPIALKTLFQE